LAFAGDSTITKFLAIHQFLKKQKYVKFFIWCF